MLRSQVLAARIPTAAVWFVAIVCLSFAYLVVPNTACAQSNLPKQIVPCDGTSLNGGTECTICHVAQLAQNILNTAIYVAVFLSAVLFAWAGWKALTSQGSTAAYSEAKSIFVNVLVGLLIILAAWLIVDTLVKTLTKGTFGPWNKVCEAIISHFDRFYA